MPWILTKGSNFRQSSINGINGQWAIASCKMNRDIIAIKLNFCEVSNTEKNVKTFNQILFITVH